jgi:hypothetical protein
VPISWDFMFFVVNKAPVLIRVIRDSFSFRPFEHSHFEFVSDFVLRISSFTTSVVKIHLTSNSQYGTIPI